MFPLATVFFIAGVEVPKAAAKKAGQPIAVSWRNVRRFMMSLARRQEG
jgi:hypothetical protein